MIITDVPVDKSLNRLYSCGILRTFHSFVNCSAVPLPLRRRVQIDAADQKCKLLARQLYSAVFRRRPVQSPLLHAPRADPQTVAIKKQHFHPVSSLVRK